MSVPDGNFIVSRDPLMWPWRWTWRATATLGFDCYLGRPVTHRMTGEAFTRKGACRKALRAIASAKLEHVQ